MFVPQLSLAWQRLRAVLVVERLSSLWRVIGLEARKEDAFTRFQSASALDW